MKEKDYEKLVLGNGIKVILTVICWLQLILCVVYAGLTASLLVTWILRGNDIPIGVVEGFMSFLSNYSVAELSTVIASKGIINVVIAGISYGIVMTFTCGIGYFLLDKFKEVYNNVYDGKIFTQTNINIINGSFILTIFYALTQPVFLYSIHNVTGVYELDNIHVGGFMYIFIYYLLKTIFHEGYKYAENNGKFNKIKRDYEAKEEEYSIELLKKDNQIKDLQKSVNKLNNELVDTKNIKEEVKPVVKKEIKYDNKVKTKKNNKKNQVKKTSNK